MTQTTTAPRTETTDPTPESTVSSTRILLAGGAFAGPLFVTTCVAQMFARDGFEPDKHPISMLSLGGPGWIQITNFVVAGLLFLGAAVGMRRVLRYGRASTWGPRLIAVYGAALVGGGVFVADPALGFPAGTPEGSAEQLSWHGIVHGVMPVIAYLSLLVACFVFARRFSALGRLDWAAYCVMTGVVTPILSFAAFAADDFRLMFVGGALTWLWASVMVARLLITPADGN